MKNPVQLINAIASVRNSLRQSPLRRGFVLSALALTWFAFSPAARAVSPPPDGGYLNGNTAEGTDAPFSLTTGFYNTAIGEDAKGYKL